MKIVANKAGSELTRNHTLSRAFAPPSPACGMSAARGAEPAEGEGFCFFHSTNPAPAISHPSPPAPRVAKPIPPLPRAPDKADENKWP